MLSRHRRLDGSRNRSGRHPLVDQRGASGQGSFVPNDTFLSNKTRLSLLITGPNMGGKSTVMRQCALIVILGQMGAPVPAARARWGSVSALYTRIGAHDAIARGQSTFMVEMSELAHILHFADARSLIILDEIGRGTSTYDGMSVAWSTLEWICNRIGCAHTLSRLTITSSRNSKERCRCSPTPIWRSRATTPPPKRETRTTCASSISFDEGPANESFGIHVARIAGLPREVIDRAWAVLEDLESNEHNTKPEPDRSQLSLFGAAR